MRKPAEIIVGKMQTTNGTISIFFFLRHKPQLCNHPGCTNQLCPTNGTGFCTHHVKHVGRAGNKKASAEIITVV